MKNVSHCSFHVCLLAGALALGFAGPRAAAATPDAEAKTILQTSGIKGGIIVHVGSGDGQLTAADVPAMLTALKDLIAYKTAHTMSDVQLRAVGDLNADFNPATQTGGVNNADLQALLDKLKGGSGAVAAVPEPTAIALSSIAAITLMLHSFRRSYFLANASESVS
jgi:hypothetical protein